MSSIAISCLRIKLLHVMLVTTFGVVRRTDRGSLTVSLFISSRQHRCDTTLKVQELRVLSLRKLYPILLSTRNRTCWDRTLSVSCLRLRILCKRLPNIRRPVPRSALHRRTVAPIAPTRKYFTAVCSTDSTLWLGSQGPLELSPPHACPTWSHCNCDYHFHLTVSDHFPHDRSDYACICSNGSFPDVAYNCVRFNHSGDVNS